jgi:5-methylcytosine-specific restriction endonuclease McrA
MTPLGLTLGHIVARAQGGADTLPNLRPEHRACNLGGLYSTALVAPLARVQRGQG